MTSSQEQNIIKSVLDGDKNAFEELVKANEKNVYNLTLKMTGSREDALDLAQEVFLRAYMRLSGFRGESKFSVWLYRLTYNLCIDFKRKIPREKTVSLTSQTEEDLREIEILDDRNNPEDMALRQEKREAIAEGLERLGELHRNILLMREITGMTYEEIATALKISEGTVKSRIFRARKSLADMLINQGTFPKTNRHN